MPKATLNFQLPEEKHEFESAYYGQCAIAALFDIKMYIRNKLKYGELSEEVYKELEELQNYIYEQTEDIPE